MCVCALGETDDYTPPPSIRISRPLHDARGVQRSVGWWGTLFLPPPHVYVAQGTHCFHPTDGSGPFLSQLLHAAKNYVLLVAPHPPCLGGSGIPKSESPPIQLPPPRFFGVSSPGGGGQDYVVRPCPPVWMYSHFPAFFRGVRFISRMFSRYDLPVILYSVFDGFDFYPVSSPVDFPPIPLAYFFVVPNFFVFPHLTPRRATRNLSDGGLAGSVR